MMCVPTYEMIIIFSNLGIAQTETWSYLKVDFISNFWNILNYLPWAAKNRDPSVLKKNASGLI